MRLKPGPMPEPVADPHEWFPWTLRVLDGKVYATTSVKPSVPWIKIQEDGSLGRCWLAFFVSLARHTLKTTPQVAEDTFPTPAPSYRVVARVRKAYVQWMQPWPAKVRPLHDAQIAKGGRQYIAQFGIRYECPISRAAFRPDRIARRRDKPPHERTVRISVCSELKVEPQVYRDLYEVTHALFMTQKDFMREALVEKIAREKRKLKSVQKESSQ